MSSCNLWFIYYSKLNGMWLSTKPPRSAMISLKMVISSRFISTPASVCIHDAVEG